MRTVSQLLGVALAAGVLAVLALSVEPAAAHRGGRYGTVNDMERALGQNRNVLLAVCKGSGTPRRNRYPRQFWEYKHFHCVVVVNAPYRRLCMTVHTLRNGRIFFSRVVLERNARPGDCG